MNQLQKEKRFGLLQKLMLSTVLCGTLFAVPNIPANCVTPGTCAELTPALQNVTVKEGAIFADVDASHTATIKAASTTTENVVITLPATNGKPNQILATDANGNLVWEEKPHQLLGMIGFMIPNNAKGIYEINGQSVTDAKLATYLTTNPISGFVVNGDSVALPDWRGRYLGATGEKGIIDTPGTLISSSNKTHTHTATTGKYTYDHSSDANGWFGASSSSRNYGQSTARTNAEGSTYARPETAGMPMVIIGESK